MGKWGWSVVAIVVLAVGCGGCTVVTVAGAAVSVAATVVSVGATVVETTVDVAASGVKAAAGSSEKKADGTAQASTD